MGSGTFMYGYRNCKKCGKGYLLLGTFSDTPDGALKNIKCPHCGHPVFKEYHAKLEKAFKEETRLGI